MSLLEIDHLETNIHLRRGVVHAVDGVTFSVDAGETVGLVGESGCGKTITGLSIMRLLPNGGRIAGGAIRFNGVDVSAMPESFMRSLRGNDIGMVFQDPMTSLNPTMTIGRQISESVRIHRGVSRQAGLDRAAEVLSLVGMPRPKERLEDYPHQLSGGLRQRVMIAMALACDPKLLIADEPTTALDVTIQMQILELLDDLKASLGMAMLLITHDMGVIAGRADKVVVMYAGKVVEQAETVEIFGRTHHPYTEALLASIPQLDQDTTQQLYSIPGLPPDLTDPPIACRFAPRCRYAQADCRTMEPPLGGLDPGHLFACFHPVNTAEGDFNEDTEVSLVGSAKEALNMVEASRAVAHSIPAVAAPASLASDPIADSDALVFLDHVSKEFSVTAGAVLQRKIGTVKAVSDVTLAIRKGETFGLVGESGCGKTTIGRMIVALERPTSGRIVFEGQDLGELKGGQLRTIRRDLQLMFQDPYASLDPRMRVGSIVREPLVIQDIGDRAERSERVAQLLGQVGLAANAQDRYPHEFSGGQRQRIGLARALTLSPKLIVADEPVSALDVSIRSQILNLMKRLQADHGLTYLVISHDLSVVRYLADRIGVMYLGKLVEVGNGTDIYEKAAHPYTAGLLATIPVPNPVVERSKRGAAIEGELPSPINPPSGCRFRTRCPLAQDICAEVEPPLRAFGPEHRAACHFPLQTPLAEPMVGSRAASF